MLMCWAVAIGLSPAVFVLPYKIKPVFVAVLSVLVAGATLAAVWPALQGQIVTYDVLTAPTIGTVQLRADLPAALFVVLVNVVVVAAAVYAIGYWENHSKLNIASLNLHLVSFLVLHLAMQMVCLLPQWFPFLVAWEIMSASSLLLMLFEYEKAEVQKAALKYLVQMHIGATFLMLGVLWLWGEMGTADLHSMSRYFATHNNIPMFFIFFVGFGFKAGFFGLHSWMADAYSAAPPQAAAIMSGAMKKLGILGIMRLIMALHGQQLEIGLILLIISILTGLYGVINAIMQRDLAKGLAFSSMENVGIMGIGFSVALIGIGVGNNVMLFWGFAGALFHVLNHTLFKSILFLGVGSVYKQTGTRNSEELGGLLKQMPHTGTILLIASIAACGLPPFNAFVSEFLIYKGLLKGLTATNVSVEVVLLLGLVAMVLIGGLALYAFTQSFGLSFLGELRNRKHANTQETNLFMYIPQYVLLAILVSVGLVPHLYFDQVINPLMTHFGSDNVVLNNPAPELVGKVGQLSAIFVALTFVIFGLRRWAVKRNGESYGATWGCGYLAGNTSMQYTATSYNNNFLHFAKPVVGANTDYSPIEELDIFPTERHFDVQPYDVAETQLIEKPVSALQKFLLKGAILQSGKLQNYILYGFIFLLTMVTLTIFNIL